MLIKPNKQLMVYLFKPDEYPIPAWLPTVPDRLEFEPLVLSPRSYAKCWIPETEADLYTIYSPSQDREYEDWEIKIMREVCDAHKVRFQLHPPPITVKEFGEK